MYDSIQAFQRLYPNTERDNQFEEWLSLKIKKRQNSNQITNAVLTIPIIFHIVNNGEAQGSGRNLGALKITHQLAQLNEDFANISGSTYGVSADIQIQFCPASIAPDGSPLAEPGIDRINRLSKGWNAPPYSITVIGSNSIINPFNHVDRTIIPESIWNPEEYFNVWIIDLETSGPFGNSTFPVSSGLPGLFALFPDTDTHSGVYLDYRCVGSKSDPGIYTSFAGLGRTLTHETGHFLGLRHIWGDGNCNTDYCDDTPTQADATENCPTIQMEQFKQNCPNVGDGGQRMFENYMDYTDDICTNTFTANQKTRMQTVLANCPRRMNLAFSTVCCNSSDLIIINPQASSNSTIAGNLVTVSFAEDNMGRNAANSNYVNIHLSADDILTPGLNGDIYLDHYFVDQTLAPLSQTILLNKEVIIPASTPPGFYYIFFAADGTGVINECAENNNFATVIITVSDAPTPSQVSYRYWFDNKFANSVSVNPSLNSNNLNLQEDIGTTSLRQGLHSFNIQFKNINDKWSSINSSFFYKQGAFPPTGTSRYEYWFDNAYSSRITNTINNSNNLVLVDNLSSNNFNDGLHTFNIHFKPDGRHWSSVTSNFFYKSTIIQNGTSQYEYWFDNDSNRITSNITSVDNFILLENLGANILTNGLHTLNIRFRPDGKKWSSVISSFIYKSNDALIPINNLAKFVYWYDSNWQSPKTISIIGVQNISWTLNTDATELSEGRHNLSMMFKDDRGKWSGIVSDSFTRGSITNQTCLNGNRQFVSGVVASNNSTYQWQVDDGNGFANISNNLFYSGTTTDTLRLTNSPSSWHGYKYRCLVANGINTIIGSVYTLKFVMNWVGLQDSNWNNPANWGCNAIPDSNTDVYINANPPNYPIINMNVTCHSLNLQPGTTIQVGIGFTINITGQQ